MSELSVQQRDVLAATVELADGGDGRVDLGWLAAHLSLPREVVEPELRVLSRVEPRLFSFDDTPFAGVVFIHLVFDVTNAARQVVSERAATA